MTDSKPCPKCGGEMYDKCKMPDGSAAIACCNCGHYEPINPNRCPECGTVMANRGCYPDYFWQCDGCGHEEKVRP